MRKIVFFCGIVLLFLWEPFSLNGQPSKTAPADTMEFKYLAADSFYAGGKLKRFFLGNYYRDAWTTPVRAPVLDIEKQAGGLHPYELGGGFQTKSLRLMDGDSNTFALRSIKKYPHRAIPENLRYPLVKYLVKDQVSASMPFGAFTVPPMADAAGVLHTNPQYFYVPDDPAFGIYRDTFAHTLVLFEERPEDFYTPVKSMGYAPRAYDSDELRAFRKQSLTHTPDQRLLLRTRLFDMILGDWDRHEGQWNWGAIENENRMIYRPIPVDRDNIYFNFEGVIPYLIRGTLVRPKFQPYKKHLQNIVGFNYNVPFVDRYFLNELDRQDWNEIADSLTWQLTDTAIALGLNRLPDELPHTLKPYLKERIQSRRDHIREYANIYYDHLARVVTIPASDQDDRFEISRFPDSILIRVYGRDNNGRRVLHYERSFKPEETEEIRLYGRGGNDIFEIVSSNEHILLRIMPGEGEDTLVYRGSNGMKVPNVILYSPDRITTKNIAEKNLNHIQTGDSVLNEYIYKRRISGKSKFSLSFEYDSDKRFALVTGWLWSQRNYNPSQYRHHHRVNAEFAPANHAYSIRYKGRWDRLDNGRTEKTLSAGYYLPGYPMLYHGYGESDPEDPYDIRFHTKLHRLKISGSWMILSGEKFKTGPILDYSMTAVEFKSFHLKGVEDAISHKSMTHAYISPGLQMKYTSNKTNILLSPRNEIELSYSYAYPLEGPRPAHKLNAGMRIYIPLFTPNLNFALRAGGKLHSENLPFPEMPLLGSEKSIRGFAPNRFAGRSRFYSNSEIRWLISKPLGILGFYDLGKIWADNQTTSWHHGIGGGVFLYFSEESVFRISYGRSADDHSLQAGMGFYF